MRLLDFLKGFNDLINKKSNQNQYQRKIIKVCKKHNIPEGNLMKVFIDIRYIPGHVERTESMGKYEILLRDSFSGDKLEGALSCLSDIERIIIR